MADEATGKPLPATGPKRKVAGGRKGKKRKARREPEWYRVRVAASSVRIDREGPGLSRQESDGRAETTLDFEGELDPPVIRMKTASIMVTCRNYRKEPGAAIGGRTIWRVVVGLPREQFADLVSLVAAQRVAKIELLLEDLRYGHGIVRSATFSTTPIPSEAEYEE